MTPKQAQEMLELLRAMAADMAAIRAAFDGKQTMPLLVTVVS